MFPCSHFLVIPCVKPSKVPNEKADLPDPGIKPGSPALQANSLPTELSGKPRESRLPINKARVYLLCFSYSTNQAWVEQGKGLNDIS